MMKGYAAQMVETNVSPCGIQIGVRHERVVWLFQLWLTLLEELSEHSVLMFDQ